MLILPTMTIGPAGLDISVTPGGRWLLSSESSAQVAWRFLPLLMAGKPILKPLPLDLSIAIQ
jgi:hypothetical protein